MTEQEAKATRCCGGSGCGAQREEDSAPMRALVMGRADDAAVLLAMQSLPRYCIGSACMAWRWNTTGPLERAGSRREQATNERGELVVTITSGIALSGFCGLAGDELRP